MNRKEFKRDHSKNEMMRIIDKQYATIKYLESQLYWRDLLCNPCHEADRLQYGWDK